jgi:phasin family protein
MADDKGSPMGKAAQAATNTASSMADAGAKATRDVGQAVSNVADAGARATRDMGQATQGLAGAGANAGRTMGQAATGAMTASAGDFSKMFEGLRMPAMPDMDLMLGAYRRNLEALSAANRVALEGAQQIARRNMEIMQQTMGEMTDAMRGLTAAESPQDRAGKQADMLKNAYERAVAHMKELADLIQRSNGEALDVLNQRFAEAMNEARTIADKSRP